MRGPRREAAFAAIREAGYCSSMLDVACGRGEALDFAASLGMQVTGTEVVPGLIGGRVIEAVAWNLPFANRSFDLVTCFDVMEHLLPGDDIAALAEINRVARLVILLTIDNGPSAFGRVLGTELHVNRRPMAEWQEILDDVLDGHVERLSLCGYDNLFRVTRDESWLAET